MLRHGVNKVVRPVPSASLIEGVAHKVTIGEHLAATVICIELPNPIAILFKGLGLKSAFTLSYLCVGENTFLWQFHELLF